LTNAQANGLGVRDLDRWRYLTCYSHTPDLPDLQRCVAARRSNVVSVAPPAAKQPWSLRDRLDEHTRADLIAAYRAGTTAASLAPTHELSLRSVKRLLAAAGVRRKQLPV
jgi:hypothetical protein